MRGEGGREGVSLCCKSVLCIRECVCVCVGGGGGEGGAGGETDT